MSSKIRGFLAKGLSERRIARESPTIFRLQRRTAVETLRTVNLIRLDSDNSNEFGVKLDSQAIYLGELVDEGGEVIQGARSCVFLNGLATVLQEQQTRIASDFELGTDRLLSGAVHLANLDVCRLGVFLGELLPRRREVLAVTAPRSEELDEMLARLDMLVEVGLGQLVETARRLLLGLLVADLFQNERFQRFDFSLSTVLLALLLLDLRLVELEGGVSFDALCRAELRRLGAVDFSDDDLSEKDHLCDYFCSTDRNLHSEKIAMSVQA